MYEPKELSVEEVNALLLSGSDDGDYKPLGLFYNWDGDTVIGVDNSTGDAWTEDFPTLEECLAWLKKDGEPEAESKDCIAYGSPVWEERHAGNHRPC